MKVYTVMHALGMDGSFPVASFTKEEDADKLCSLYNSSEECGDYDYHYRTTVEIDEYNINDFELKDGVLFFNGEEF